MKKALITGITGQDGSYLAELLLGKGYEVHGMVRRSSTERFDRIGEIRDRLHLHQADLLDQLSIVRLIDDEQEQSVAEDAVEVILDASGSMYQKLDGRFRYQIAKDVLDDLVATTIPEEIGFALRVFGNREPSTCRTDLEVRGRSAPLTVYTPEPGG